MIKSELNTLPTIDHGPPLIKPYPSELEETISWNGYRVLLRPIRPEDEAQHLRFLQAIDSADMRMRIFSSRREITPAELSHLASIDYDLEMAFIATTSDPVGYTETIGVVRTISDAGYLLAEMAILVRSDLKSKGLGRLLLNKMIRYCRRRRIKELTASALQGNSRMLALATSVGFAAMSTSAGVVEVRLKLSRPDNPALPTLAAIPV